MQPGVISSYVPYCAGFNSTTIYLLDLTSTLKYLNTFQGPFKKRAGPDSIWKTVREDVDHSHFECDKSADNDYRIPTSREYQLMDRAVPSTLNRPIYKVRLIFLFRYIMLVRLVVKFLRVPRCQKVPKSDFQSQFSSQKPSESF